MTAPYIPDPEWHKQKTPEQWQAIQAQALKDHRINPQDHEAMNAIRDSNEALNLYEQPAITAGEHTLHSGWGNPLEAIKGEAEGGLDALLSPFHLANTVYRNGAAAGVDEVWNGLKSIPGEIASGDPRRIGRVAGGVAGSFATGKAIGKVAGKVGRGFGQAAELPKNLNTTLEEISEHLKKGNNDNPSGGGSSMAPKPKPPVPPSTPDILDPREQAKKDFMESDPYGLNDLKNTKAPPGMKDNIMDSLEGLNKYTDPKDGLGNFIGNLRSNAEAPHDILGPDNMGTKPMSPEELNRILGDILKKPPNNK